MKLLQTTAFCLAIAFSATSAMADGKAISKIDVTVELSDFANSNALDFYPDLETDIARAIAERVEVTSDMKDPHVKIFLKKLAVDGDTMLPDTMEFNEIVGSVAIFAGTEVRESEDSAKVGPVASDTIHLVAKADVASVPEGWVVIPPSQEDFYDKMIEAFAEAVVAYVEEEA